jgi:hypothetical protein
MERGGAGVELGRVRDANDSRKQMIDDFRSDVASRSSEHVSLERLSVEVTKLGPRVTAQDAEVRRELCRMCLKGPREARCRATRTTDGIAGTLRASPLFPQGLSGCGAEGRPTGALRGQGRLCGHRYFSRLWAIKGWKPAATEELGFRSILAMG